MKFSTRSAISTLVNSTKVHERIEALELIKLSEDFEDFDISNNHDHYLLSLDSLEIRINRDATAEAYDNKRFLAAA